MNLIRLRTPFLLALGVAVATATSAPAQTDRSPGPLALIHANVLDVRTGRIALDRLNFGKK